MICWTDLETTGSDPRRHCILEVACIITDDQLEEQARYHAVIFTATAHAIHHAKGRMPLQPTVDGPPIGLTTLRRHSDNGLWRESALMGRDGLVVLRELGEFIDRHTPVVDGERRPMRIAGFRAPATRWHLQCWGSSHEGHPFLMPAVTKFLASDVLVVPALAHLAFGGPEDARALPRCLRSVEITRTLGIRLPVSDGSAPTTS